MLGLINGSGTLIPRDKFAKIKDSFECKNHKKQQAMRLQTWGWQKLPDKIQYWKPVGEYVKVPYGITSFRPDLFEDKTSFPTVEHPAFIGELFDAQKEKLSELTSRNVGMMYASTGVGKGVMIPWLALNLKTKALVVVPGTQLLAEMVGRFEKHAGITPAKLGGAKKSQKDAYGQITVATIDSAVKLTETELRGYGCVLLDEVDKYVTTEKRTSFLMRLAPKYMYGFTGTMSLNFVDPKTLKIFFGEVTEFVKHNYVPKIHRVRTRFTYSGGELEDMKDFTTLNNEVCLSSLRNSLISETVLKSLPNSETKKGILLTNRTEHAYQLKEALEKAGLRAYVIVGEVAQEERDEIKRAVTESNVPTILIGNASILGRGFDLPQLQIAYLAYPSRFDANVIQACGRVIRPADGKTYCEVYDFVDENVKILRNQGNSRLNAMRKEYKNPVIVNE